MKAEILDSSSSPPAGDVNYKTPVPPPAPSGRRWRLSIFLSIGVVGLLASFVIAAITLHSRAEHPSAPSPSVSASAEDKPWNAPGYVDIEGGVTPLYPLQIGRVKSIEVKENEFVKAGAPLFRVDDAEQQLKVQQAKAGVEEAQGQLKAAQAKAEALQKKIAAQQEAIKLAEIEVERARALRDEKSKLADKNIGSKFEAEDAKHLVEKAREAVRLEQAKLAALEVLKGEISGSIAMARANLEYKQALLAEAENAVKECVVRAPVDGTPLRILVTLGETLGANPRQPAIQFAASRPLLVRAEVGQEFAGRVRLNQSVIVKDNITGQECARGKVASIALWYAPSRAAHAELMPINNSDNRTLECIIFLDPSPQSVRLGQRVSVQFRD